MDTEEENDFVARKQGLCFSLILTAEKITLYRKCAFPWQGISNRLPNGPQRKGSTESVILQKEKNSSFFKRTSHGPLGACLLLPTGPLEDILKLDLLSASWVKRKRKIVNEKRLS